MRWYCQTCKKFLPSSVELEEHVGHKVLKVKDCEELGMRHKFVKERHYICKDCGLLVERKSDIRPEGCKDGNEHSWVFETYRICERCGLVVDEESHEVG
ncbi:MAG: hypothetical protein JRD89_21335 [Deltaproteobacteria bacterium]|nr:hypothetical protein [Deltaproteobacteria bacterium]